MKILKNITALIVGLCLMLCCIGCGDEYDNFKPVGVQIVESIGGLQYETLIEDEKITKEMWSIFESLNIDTETEAKMGSSYLYMCFYNEDQSLLGIFTIYENGACCLGEDFTTFYTVTDGREVYLDLCDIYTAYEEE